MALFRVARRISLDKAEAIAQTQFPNAELRWIETPNSPEDTYKIFLYQDGEPSKRFPKTIVWMDQYAGESFIKWLHPLHNGEIAGLTQQFSI
ncbi:PepSY domain-containing protein [Methylicorpusculum sp.]|uniref:PepSY domain-containing protein n=1 Tax=Methylicorpusculum sp. TaxID=2713644 RepID=UPI0027198B5D|nr:PepSY domain-containing protein [Methylicorpusculum sp.]MDO8844701.1 PepSY domain-containing protein [Methylicorpusculum sp.]